MLAVLYLAVYLFCGCVIARALLPRLNAPARVWIGLCAGVLLQMWLPALLAFVFRFSVTGHLLALIPLALITLGAWLARDRAAAPRPLDAQDKGALLLLVCVALPLTVLGGYLQYTHCLRASDGALHVGQSTYGDLPLHLGIITSLRNAKFPADYAILPGQRLTYPFLTDSFSTSFMLFGMDLAGAVTVPGTLLMALTFAGYVLLAARMASSRRAAVLAALFVFLNGGLGFLYSLDTLGVSNGTSALNSLQAGTWLERLDTILSGWYLTPANHAEQAYYNLRWSNIIADMLIPQRTFLGGVTLLLPCLYLLYDGVSSSALREKGEKPAYDLRQMALLGVMAGALPLIHTHSFLALGLVSAGWMAYDLLRGGKLAPWLIYGGLACLLAAPQLFLWTFKQTAGNERFVYLQFNWVNNAGGNGLRDGYLIFYIKNIGLPFVLLLLSLLEKNRRRRFIASGAFVIFLLAEFVVFQPNEYDNNKLFYVWWMLCAVLAADYAFELYERLRGLRARAVIAALSCVLFFATGTLSLARECKSDYQMFSAADVETAAFAEENTPEHATFICWTQHINPVSALAGRSIVCGPSLWLYWHGFNLSERESDIIRFYADPRGNGDVLEAYNVDYILIGSYERANLAIDQSAMDELYALVFESADGAMRIYAVDGGNARG